VIGEKGVEKIVKIRLKGPEQQMFAQSLASVQGLVDACKQVNPALAK
jgi:malate dehydrogenase